MKISASNRGLSAAGWTAVIALASYRIWALLALDTITKRLRKAIFTEARSERRLYTWLKLFVKCPWCAGFWVTAVVTFVLRRRVPAWVAVLWAAAAGTALLGGNDDRLHESDEDLGYA